MEFFLDPELHKQIYWLPQSSHLSWDPWNTFSASCDCSCSHLLSHCLSCITHENKPFISSPVNYFKTFKQGCLWLIFTCLALLIWIVPLRQTCKFCTASHNAGITDKNMFCTPAGKQVGHTFDHFTVAAPVWNSLQIIWNSTFLALGLLPLEEVLKSKDGGSNVG